MIVRPSPNFNDRPVGRAPDMVLLHYTGMATAAEALDRLVQPEAGVSAHYLIDEDGTSYALVPEDKRAWHAGVSFWAGERDINGCSIGIELVNPGHALPGYAGGYRPFPEAQMTALLDLLGGISRRHNIPAARLLAHSDVAPARKQDPGELFDWERLAEAGFGLMPGRDQLRDPGPFDWETLQADLSRFGYGLDMTGADDAPTREVITAFQRHYRRTSVTGMPDADTRAVLANLLGQINS
ncbi:N-acetylmuramoyl-L-alanine amidase [Govanella unica]|uniref:N-acetylmuramoyl-L-alanine amidase n=1 Tax=Govanella unica TaxID=2975056 RepID=A0A9X3U131_9PROT|nr:N-acetylmuramoyl-L-alanine amidase [Govania unica]MDA5195067.1 N-acetylmuramoyl-L-alanine amidase [Govania unica]